MKNKETNIKKNNQRSKSKTTVKQRGYYYSKENIMKRKQSEKIEIDSINYNENIISAPIKLKWNNELELYNKNNSLIQFLELEKDKFNYILNIFKELNKNFGDILIKPKIKIAEINKKIQNEQYKKEKENYIFNQNLSDKIDDALIKANLALEKVKNIGKKAIILPSTQNEKNIYTKYGFEKPKEKNELSEIIKRCQDKYVDSIQINKDNINIYFMSLRKIRTLFRDFKERIRRSKQKLKEYPNIFDDIYNKNKKKMDIDSNNNNNNILYGDDNIIKEENKMIKICSILSSDLFCKLYNKVMFNEKNDKNNQINEEDIYNVFSLWFMINHIGVLLEENQGIEKLNLKLTKFYPLKFTLENYLNASEFQLINQNIIKVIQKFFDYLNRKTLNSNNKDVEINENEVFEKNFYKLYNVLQKIEQIKAIKFISENIEKKYENNSLNKEELNYFKNLQSIFTNNGYYSCNICKK